MALFNSSESEQPADIDPGTRSNTITPIDVDVFRLRMQRIEQTIARCSSKTSVLEIAVGVMLGIWAAAIVPWLVLALAGVVSLNMFGASK